MSKISFKPGNMLYPLPAVLVSAMDEEGNVNAFTVAWAGTVCTNPPMVSISVRPSRYSYDLIKKRGEFVINLTTQDLVYATDYCGVRSGRDEDKLAKLGLCRQPSKEIATPGIAQSPVNIECRVKDILELGSHHMFLAEVVNVQVDAAYMDEKKSFHLDRAKPIVYSHGGYFSLGKKLGTFGYSIAKKQETKCQREKRSRKPAGKPASRRK